MSRYQKMGLAVIVIGVIAGSILANLTYKANYYYLAELNMDLCAMESFGKEQLVSYGIYIALKRCMQLLVLTLLVRLFITEVLVFAAGFTGAFSFSVFFTYQMLQSGIQAGIRMLVAMFPQWICYGAVLYFLLRKEKKSVSEIFIIGGLFIFGIAMEIFVNPQLILPK